MIAARCPLEKTDVHPIVIIRPVFHGLGSGEAALARPLNVLVLYADDWRFDTLGCAGNPVVQTPQLDQLARESTRFTHACVTTAICGVSRASLFTGQWMSRHGNTAFNAFKTPWMETWPGLLRAQGYYTGHIGKWHNGKFPQENFDFGRAYSGTHWITEPDGSRIHVTQKNENDALEFLRTRPADRPFCLTVAFFATHAEDGNPLQFLPSRRPCPSIRIRPFPCPKRPQRKPSAKCRPSSPRRKTKAASAGTGASIPRRNTRQ